MTSTGTLSFLLATPVLAQASPITLDQLGTKVEIPDTAISLGPDPEFPHLQLFADPLLSPKTYSIDTEGKLARFQSIPFEVSECARAEEDARKNIGPPLSQDQVKFWLLDRDRAMLIAPIEDQAGTRCKLDYIYCPLIGPQTQFCGLQTIELPEPPSETIAIPDHLLGEWKFVLNKERKRRMQLLELGLKDPPPTAEDLAVADLSIEELQFVFALQNLMRTNPQSPEVVQARMSIELMRDYRLVFSETHRTENLGPQGVQVATYIVMSVDGDQVVIDHKPVAEAPMGGQWAPTRILYTRLDANTVATHDTHSGLQATLQRVTEGQD